jgi:hypothetical protein
MGWDGKITTWDKCHFGIVNHVDIHPASVMKGR